MPGLWLPLIFCVILWDLLMFEGKLCPRFPSAASSELSYWDSSKAAASLLCGCSNDGSPAAPHLLCPPPFLCLPALSVPSTHVMWKGCGQGRKGCWEDKRKESPPFFHSVLLVVETPVLRAAKSGTWRRRGRATGRSWSA